jgi:hypothetical protein
MIWVMPIRVAGVTKHLLHLDNLLGDDVVLEREPNNPFHVRAIAIFAVKDNQRQKLGYVPKELADMVRDSDLPARGLIVWKRQIQYPALRIQA